MTAGAVEDLKPASEDAFAGILIGKDLSGTLSAFPGDVITLVTPQGSLSPMGLMPRQRRAQIVGTFKLGLFEFDQAYGFVDLHLPRIVAIASLGNVASHRVLEKIGLHRLGERTLPHPAYADEGPMAWFERDGADWIAERAAV